jgi:hypothetical protein
MATVRICLCFKSLQSLTAAALFGRSKWRESREGVSIWCSGPQGPLIRECGVSMDVSFQGDSNETNGGRVWLRRPCPTLAAVVIADSVKSCFGSLRASDRDVWGIYGCIFSWRFQWHYRHQRPCPTSAARDTAVFSRRWPYWPTLMSSHETVHTDLYILGEGVW